MSNSEIIVVENTLGFAVEPDRNPAVVYLSSLPSKKSQRTMLASLKSLVQMMKGQDVYTFAWWNLDYQYTQSLRSRLISSEYTPASVNRMLAALRGVLKECWRLGLMDVETYNRAADLQNVKDMKLPAGRYIPKTEMQRMLDACYADKNRWLGVRDVAILSLLYLVGPRRAEVAGIKLGDYDPGSDGSLLLHGKNRKERTVYVVGDCRQKINAWLDIRGDANWDEPLFYHIEKNGTITRKGISGNAIYEIVADRSRAAGLGKTTPHDFRRSAVSNLLGAGVDPITVAAITGHASVEMVKRYDRRKEQPKIDALKKLTLT